MTGGWSATGSGRSTWFAAGVPSGIFFAPSIFWVRIALARCNWPWRPPSVSETVAGVTLLVLRARDAAGGMAHYLWYCLTSAYGRQQVVRRLTVNATIISLSANLIADVKVPLPSPHQLTQVASLVEASWDAYTAAIIVARLHRETIRNSVIREIVSGAA